MRKSLVFTASVLILTAGAALALGRGRYAPPEAPIRMLRVLRDGEVSEMAEEEYLAGVIAAELPGGFLMEARKAQAVAARTYARSRGDKHPGADVCTDAACCQAYRESYAPADLQAARETAGLVMTYGGELIDATFFSGSGGRTEAAAAVWGADVPYLQSVESPGEQSPNDEVTITLPAGEFAERLGIDPEGEPEEWLGAMERTAGGGVARWEIGGQEFTGTELRRLLNLKSTAMEITPGEKFTITTHGFGHRVGLSQYGAQAMAERGCGFREILEHYYIGVELTVDSL